MDAMRLSTLLLCLLLASVSAVGKLKKIEDLKNVDYGKPFPRHGLQLLFWFAQQVNRADQNVIHMNSDFNPKGNFGFHEFGNYEKILPNISIRGVKYYSVGNLNSDKYPDVNQLPCYVKKYYDEKKPLSNMDRLMISVKPNSPKTVDSVYITAHIKNSRNFDPSATYEIDSTLINNIRINQPYDDKEECERCYDFLKRTGYTTGDVPFRVNPFRRRQLHSLTAGFQIEFSESIFCQDSKFDHFTIRIKGFDASLELYTEDGYACARLYIKKTFTNWQNDFYYSWVGFYKGPEQANDKYSTHQYAVKFQRGEGDNTKDYDIYEYRSSLAIATGVQIRFLLDKNYNNVLAKTTPWAGTETEMMSPDFDCLGPGKTDISSYGNADIVIPVEIKGFDASLRLYGEDGRASARLYIKKTFSDWQDYFSDSWVGFYTGKEIANGEYYTYQYAVKFEKEGHLTGYDVFKYQSSLLIAPGVQIRFLLNQNLNTELAQTLPWEAELV